MVNKELINPLQLEKELDDEIPYDIIEIFTDNFDEIYTIIQDLDLSKKTIDNLMLLIEKDIKCCIRNLDKFHKLNKEE